MRPQSIVHLFQEACSQFNKPAAVMVKIDGTYKSFSHKFFKQRVNHFGRGLLDLGLAAGEHVAILSETRFEWAIADLGILSAGGVVVPVYQTLLPDQVAYILNNSESVGVVCSDLVQAEKVLEVKAECPNLRFIIVMEEQDELPDGVEDMPSVETRGSRQDNEHILEERTEALQPDQLLTIIYTSGTTGNPKGVMLTHDNLISNIKSIEPFMPFTDRDTCLSHLPLSHVFERMSGYYAMLYRGVTIAYAEDIKTVPQNLLEVKPSVLVSVPRLFEKIYAKIMANMETSGFVKRKIFTWALKTGRKALPSLNNNRPLTGLLASKWNMADKLVYSKIREKTGGNLKFMFSGGAPLAREIAEMFLGMGMTMIEGYGLTETSPVLTVNRPDKNKPGTVGPAVPDVELKIADDGEILARGPNIMQGYYKNPEATSEAIVDGWFHTGDIGVLDEDGYLRITDRKKDLIVTSGGKNIAPQPMENALKLSPFIEQAIVIGEKRNFVSALIVPPWENVDEWAPLKGWSSDPLELASDPQFYDAVMADVAKQLKGFAHYEKVKKITILPHLLSVETGELTPSLKVKRRVVNQKFAGLIDAMYD